MHSESCIYPEKFVNSLSSYSTIKLPNNKVTNHVYSKQRSSFFFQNYGSLTESSFRNSTAASDDVFLEKK